MKVLVFDNGSSVSGHRIPYAALVAKSFREHDVVVCLPSQLEGEPALKTFFEADIDFYFFELQEKNKTLALNREAWRCFKTCIAVQKPDLVAVPTADGMAFWGGLLNLFGLLGLKKTPIDISLMKGHFKSPTLPIATRLFSQLKWWVVTRGPWKRILLIDPRSFEDLANPESSGVQLCPDPAPKQKFFDRREARIALDLPLHGKIIASVGGQDTRKGVDLLLQAFEKAKLGPDIFLVLFGKFDSRTNQIADRMLLDPRFQKSLIIRDEYVSDDELEQTVVASNLVAVPYRDVERPSGIVSRAVAWGRPILATDRGWLKWFVQRYQAGYLTHPENTTQFAEDIEAALCKSDHFRTSPAADKFRTFNTELCYLDVWNAQSAIETLVNPVT
jgi:hypothetical protein